MNKIIQILVLLLCSYGVTSSAANDEQLYRNKLNHCKLSTPTLNNYEPAVFQTTNNLLRSTGQNPIYCGEKVIIKGTLLDKNCVPVSDAKVYLWQVGCDGKYPYKTLRTRVDKNHLNLENGSTFTGSGIATTNNEGEFYFITIYPVMKHGDPHVNIRVEHRDLGSLQTQLHFKKALEARDIVDSSGADDMDGEAKIYNFNVVMPGETLKRY